MDSRLKPPPLLKQFFANFLANFTVLRGAVRELWIVFGVKFLALFAYGVVTSSTLKLWLRSDLHCGDVQAGVFFTAWSLVMTFCTVLVGSLVDAIGLRKAVLIGLSTCFISRGIMAFTTDKWAVLGCGLFPLAVGGPDDASDVGGCAALYHHGAALDFILHRLRDDECRLGSRQCRLR